MDAKGASLMWQLSEREVRAGFDYHTFAKAQDYQRRGKVHKLSLQGITADEWQLGQRCRAVEQSLTRFP